MRSSTSVKLTSSACGPGTQLNPQGDGCEKATPQGSLIFSATSDRIWGNLRYNNNGSVSALGDLTTVTATQNVTDATRIYLLGVGSLNGTYLDGERIDEAPLREGAQVQVGKFRLVFVIGTLGGGS